MRHVVMLDDVRQLQLWPSELFDTYLEHTKNEIKRFFKKESMKKVNCPACNSDDSTFAFKKFGLSYVKCNKCKSLYLSPRPDSDAINNYFHHSKAANFWYSELVKHSLKDRAAHQSIPRALWIADLTQEFFREPLTFVSINEISQSLLEEISGLNIFKNKYLFDPFFKNASNFINNNDFKKIINKDINANAATAFGSIDRAFSPNDLLQNARKMLTNDGLFFCTTSTISGFDLQILWDKAKNIFPPDRINLLSIEGFHYLFERNGFEIIELSTPGQLDVEIVKNSLKDNHDNIPRFIEYLLNNRDITCHQSLQEFLQQFKLSSHIRIAARKKI